MGIENQQWQGNNNSETGDQDIALAVFAGRDSCLNASPAFIHSEIAARARAVGYVEGQSLQVMESPNPTSHDYNFTDLIARIAAFIQ